jgi:SAM-dependent methyltransferase
MRKSPSVSGEHTSDQYAKKALPIGFVRRLARVQQNRVYDAFARHFPPHPGLKVLDLGVSPSYERAEYFFFERNYPYTAQIVAAGLEPPGKFSEWYPQVTYVQVARGEALPFEDGEFDVVFCSAVIEHVGSRDNQRRFLAEILRVGKGAFVTTPNRWYPVELHTVLPFVHYLPAPVYRKVLRRLGFDFFSHEENLNLLDERSLSALVPPSRRARIHPLRFLGFRANLLLVAQS